MLNAPGVSVLEEFLMLQRTLSGPNVGLFTPVAISSGQQCA